MKILFLLLVLGVPLTAECSPQIPDTWMSKVKVTDNDWIEENNNRIKKMMIVQSKEQRNLKEGSNLNPAPYDVLTIVFNELLGSTWRAHFKVHFVHSLTVNAHITGWERNPTIRDVLYMYPTPVVNQSEVTLCVAVADSICSKYTKFISGSGLYKIVHNYEEEFESMMHIRITSFYVGYPSEPYEVLTQNDLILLSSAGTLLCLSMIFYILYTRCCPYNKAITRCLGVVCCVKNSTSSHPSSLSNKENGECLSSSFSFEGMNYTENGSKPIPRVGTVRERPNEIGRNNFHRHIQTQGMENDRITHSQMRLAEEHLMEGSPLPSRISSSFFSTSTSFSSDKWSINANIGGYTSDDERMEEVFYDEMMEEGFYGGGMKGGFYLTPTIPSTPTNSIDITFPYDEKLNGMEGGVYMNKSSIQKEVQRSEKDLRLLNHREMAITAQVHNRPKVKRLMETAL